MSTQALYKSKRGTKTIRFRLMDTDLVTPLLLRSFTTCQIVNIGEKSNKKYFLCFN